MSRIHQSKVVARNWASLQDAIDGEVALPGSSLYERTYKPFNARFHDVLPAAIVLCETPQDVSESISFLNRTDWRKRYEVGVIVLLETLLLRALLLMSPLWIR